MPDFPPLMEPGDLGQNIGLLPAAADHAPALHRTRP